MQDNLEELNVNSNPIELLDPSFKNLSKLTVLGISYTKIKEIPDTICKLENLQSINVYGTPIDEPKQIIALRGVTSIKRYFANMN